MSQGILSARNGKTSVRRKGAEFVKKIEAVHTAFTSGPVVRGNHFVVGSEVDITAQDLEEYK